MYKIGDVLYHGKYIGYVSDEYEEGLDIEVRAIFYPLWKKTYSLSRIEDVTIGIVSSRRDGFDYFSEHEKGVFDTLYCNWTNEPVEVYINGVKIIIE